MRKFITLLQISAFILSVVGSLRSSFAQESPSLAIVGGCAKDETWELQGVLPKFLKGALSGPPKNKEDAIQAYVSANQLSRVQNARAHHLFLARYVMARSLLEMGFVHGAFSEFNLLAADPGLPGSSISIFISSLECLSTLHSRYYSFRIYPAIEDSIQAVVRSRVLGSPNSSSGSSHEAQYSALWQAATSILAGKLVSFKSQDSDSSRKEVSLSSLEGSGPYLSLIQSLRIAHLDQFRSLRQQAEDFVRVKGLPSELTSAKDGLELNLGYLYYGESKYNQAIAHFSEVPNSSSLFPNAVLGMAWSYFQNKEYKDAADSTLNLVSGRLRNVFSPNAYLILAMSLLETCNYKESLEVIQLFRKEYGQVYRKLYDWYGQDRSGGVDFYSLALSGLQGKRPLPKRILAEWVRSPIFIGKQKELNLYRDEAVSADETLEILDRWIGEGDPKLVGYYKVLRRWIHTQNSYARTKTGALTEQIGKDMRWKNRAMISTLVDAYENAKLIEADIYKAMGRFILKRNDRARDSSGQPSEGRSVHAPRLDWGEASTSENEESWADEVGNFEVDLTDSCKNPRVNENG